MVFLLYGGEVLESVVGEVPGFEVVVYLFLAEVERQVAEDDSEPVVARPGDQLEQFQTLEVGAKELLVTLAVLLEGEGEELQGALVAELYQEGVDALVVDEGGLGDVEAVVFPLDVGDLVKDLPQVVLHHLETRHQRVQVLDQQVPLSALVRLRELPVIDTLGQLPVQTDQTGVEQQGVQLVEGQTLLGP